MRQALILADKPVSIYSKPIITQKGVYVWKKLKKET